jgi:hypothetical protein
VIQPNCLQCGKPIPKKTEWQEYRHTDENAPRSKAEAQRLFNATVVGLRYWPSGRACSVFTWDGESYQDEYFCAKQCAERFGRRAARLGVRL